jgi:hypothetical protein
VFEIFKNLQALRNDGMAFLVLDMGNKTDAASVAFMGGVVKALGRGKGHRTS